MTQESLLSRARSQFHAGLLLQTLTVDANGIASNADRSSVQSRTYAASVATALRQETTHERAAGQTLGGSFERAVVEFLRETFIRLDALRPGDWKVENLGSARSAHHIAQYEPYTHLAALDRAASADPTLRSILGNAYMISPDVVVSRTPAADAEINTNGLVVDERHGVLSPIRSHNRTRARILHAVISCKWTLRSDRAQNARSEALNLIRNRKGRTPHIVVVTAEPLPSRISSLALGTGDIDAVYHFALPELRAAVEHHGTEESQELLTTMVEGQRLRDIADLPLDLTI